MCIVLCACAYICVYVCACMCAHLCVCVSMCDYIEQYYLCHSYYLPLILSDCGTTDSISEVYCGLISHPFHLAVEIPPPEVTLTAQLCSSKWVLFSFIRQPWAGSCRVPSGPWKISLHVGPTNLGTCRWFHQIDLLTYSRSKRLWT